MSKYHLNHKVLYDPEENFARTKSLYTDEYNQGYRLLMPYSDLGAFVAPLEVAGMQNYFRDMRKLIAETFFTPCSVRNGLEITTGPHVNIDLKTFVDFGADGLAVTVGQG